MATITEERAAVRRLLDSPEGRRLTAQQEADALTVRRAKVSLLKSTEAEHLKALPGLRERTKEAALTVSAAHDVMLAAQRDHAAALLAESRARWQADAERGRLERELRESAPPEIAEFIRVMSASWAHTRRTPVAVSGGTLDGRGGFSPVTCNAEAVQARMAAVNVAREGAERLMLEALDGPELVKRLTALRAGIPEVD